MGPYKDLQTRKRLKNKQHKVKAPPQLQHDQDKKKITGLEKLGVEELNPI